ncbi:hypothetical protein OESDEN_03332 [Oesophagostomum dentatum]|uniref:Uncharacterized protein n=1 Tax=Oesophagostomum dentatum TaxID=61180 RepID=A0A0B1TGQ3_OESDE|nr:hypothetical protein OESDEN_03332 [Oesophagostomum dentatum]
MYVLMSGEGESDEIVKENIKKVANVPESEQKKGQVQEKESQNTTADVKLGSGREVVFELSYDYEHLDADGKPQKHLVRVTPSSEPPAASKPTPSSSAQSSVFEGNDHGNIRSVSRNEANEVFFGEVEQQEDNPTEDSSNVVLGDVLFVDADGNEIIQRTTALPDGTYQQQYLGQAEDGSLFLLDDIVSAGLHPYTETVEEVYDGDIIDENVEAQEIVLEEEYGNVTSQSFASAAPGRSGVAGRERFEGTAMRRSYNSVGNAVVQQGYSDHQGIRQQFDSDVVDDGSVHYDEGEVPLNTNKYEQPMESYSGEQQFEETPVTKSQQK